MFWDEGPRTASKSPLERGGPLAVGSVLFEPALLTRFFVSPRSGHCVQCSIMASLLLWFFSSSFSEDGGPLTDNIVFSSVQPLFPREARLAARSATGHRR